MFQYHRNIHVYETDLMGIVHHSNYLRYCEESRVAWCLQHGLLDSTRKSVFSLVVYETLVRHKAPCHYGDQLTIDVQVRVDKAKLILQYRLKVQEKIVAVAQTVHCSLDEDFKVLRLDKKVLAKVIESLEKEKWIETWL